MNPRILRSSLAGIALLAFSSIARADATDKPVDLAGVWNVTAITEEAERSVTWTFTKDGEAVTGMTRDNESGDERKLDRVTVEGKKVILEIDYERDGNSGVIRIITEQAEPGKLVGKWSIIGSDGTTYMTGAASAIKEATIAFAGDWKTTSKLPDGKEITTGLTLTGANSELKGAFTLEDGKKVEIDQITTGENHVRFAFDVAIEENTMNVVIEAKSENPNKLVGVWIIKGADGAEADKGEWTATRNEAPDFSGEWNATAIAPDGQEHHSTLTLTRAGANYTGKATSEQGGERDLSTVAIEGKHLTLTLKMERDGQSGTITVKAEQKDDGSLEGKWSISDQDGGEVAGDAWTAKRP
jgi:hypothetical protein